jgi:hypothetical protein
MSTTEPPIVRRVKRISPLQAGKMLGILYGAMGLLFVPFIVLMITLAPRGQNGQTALPAIFGGAFALFAPVIYGVMGFVLGVIGAAIYNLAARFVGGIEVEVE